MEELVFFPTDSKREVSMVSKEDVKDGGMKDIIIYQGPKQNIFFSRIGDVRVLETIEIEKENHVEQEDFPSTPRKVLTVSWSLAIELEREASISPKPKKRNIREPSMALPVETRRS